VLGARWLATPYLSLELDSGLAILGGESRYGGATASFDCAAVRGWLLWEISDEGRVRPSVGMGGGLLVIWSRGIASNSLVLSHDVRVTGYAGISAQVAMVLTDLFRIRTGAQLGFSLPAVDLTFGDEDVASFGEPLFELYVALEATLL